MNHPNEVIKQRYINFVNNLKKDILEKGVSTVHLYTKTYGVNVSAVSFLRQKGIIEKTGNLYTWHSDATVESIALMLINEGRKYSRKMWLKSHPEKETEPVIKSKPNGKNFRGDTKGIQTRYEGFVYDLFVTALPKRNVKTFRAFVKKHHVTASAKMLLERLGLIKKEGKTFLMTEKADRLTPNQITEKLIAAMRKNATMHYDSAKTKTVRATKSVESKPIVQNGHPSYSFDRITESIIDLVKLGEKHGVKDIKSFVKDFLVTE